MYSKNAIYLFFSILTFCISGCQIDNQKETLRSPNGKMSLDFETINGQIFYSLKCDTQQIIYRSKLGYQFKNMAPIENDLKISHIGRNSVNETWEQVWGAKRLIENRYEELIINLEEQSGEKRKLNLYFRLFDDGLGFRYQIPEQKNIDTIIITAENTQFHLANVKTTWWIPAYKEVYYESLYRHTTLEKIDTVCTPVTLEFENGKFLAIHEANLAHYAAMNLYYSGNNTLTTDLTPWSTGEKVFTHAGMYSPWRTITIGDKPGDLITSYIELNLNEPNKLKDVSWIKPGKYIGIWWAIHMEKYTWAQGPKHGATTKNTKAYMDFAAKHGFSGVLVEGWNNGWDFDWVHEGNRIKFTEAYPDFDLEAITKYGAARNVKLIGHHETGGAVKNYESQMDEAFKLYQNAGVNCVKTGYVNPKLEGKEFHSSQFGVEHYRKVIETAARYKIVIDNHEPVMPTGLQRTYPNLMTQEGVRGQEYDAWSKDGGNPPEHTTIIPFTRGLAGPMDFTFGTFNFTNKVNPGTRVQTTIAKQLALYVVIYSPLQMASDLPENYENNKAFQFIEDVPTDWTDTRVLDAVIGDYVCIARKDRNSDDWFLGSITDENARKIEIKLDFLDPDKTYIAQIYQDSPDADWKTNPTGFKYIEQKVDKENILILDMKAGGGQAIRFIPLIKKY